MPRQRRSRGEPVLWPGLGMQVALSALCTYLHSTFPRLNQGTLGEETTPKSQPCLPAVQCAVSGMQLTVQTGHRRMVEPSASVPTITISFSWQQSEEYGTSQPRGQPSRPRRGLGIGGRRPSLECSSARGKPWCAQPRGRCRTKEPCFRRRLWPPPPDPLAAYTPLHAVLELQALDAPALRHVCHIARET